MNYFLRLVNLKYIMLLQLVWPYSDLLVWHFYPKGDTTYLPRAKWHSPLSYTYENQCL